MKIPFPQSRKVAADILGAPLGRLVRSVEIRPTPIEEKARWAGFGLTVGDTVVFELDAPPTPAKQFVVTSK